MAGVAPNVDLVGLAASTNGALQAIWDDLGVSAAERTSLINKLSADVVGIFNSSVALQEARRRDCEAEIGALLTTLDNMQCAMEQQAVLPARGGKTILDFRAALDAQRAMLQETWDARHTELKALQAALTSLCSDVGCAVEVSATRAAAVATRDAGAASESSGPACHFTG